MADRVRRATVDDASAIGALHVASWQTAYRGLVPDEVLDGLDPVAWTERRHRHLADPIPGSVNTVVEREGRVVGWCAFGPTREPGLAPDVGELYALYLHPQAFNAGCGRALWEDALATVRAWSAPEIVLWVFRDNDRSRRFYRIAGFTDDPRVPPRDVHGAPSVRMVRPLP